MGTVNKNYMTKDQSFGGVPFGNVYQQKFHFETNSAGVMVENGAAASDLATAVTNGSVVRLGILPAGLELQDAQIIISDAFAGSTTMDVGFQYTDGVDAAAPNAQQDDFFCEELATSSTGITRKTTVTAPVTLPKDAYLILTRLGADDSAVGIVDIIVIGRNTGGF